MDPFIKAALGFAPDTPEEKVREDWNKRTKNVCKPCWEIKYCPYGILVEQFPLLSSTREDAIKHNDFLKKQLIKGAYDEERRLLFEKEVKEFDPNEYPIDHDPKDLEKECLIYGHMCPVFFVNEPFTETKEKRRFGRYIPRHIMLKVVRRDNNQCQECGRVLKDDEIEFDHVIPISRGGSSEAHNLRLTCFECNRNKSDEYEP